MRLADPAERVAARADVDAPELELEQRVHPQVFARATVLVRATVRARVWVTVRARVRVRVWVRVRVRVRVRVGVRVSSRVLRSSSTTPALCRPAEVSVTKSSVIMCAAAAAVGVGGWVRMCTRAAVHVRRCAMRRSRVAWERARCAGRSVRPARLTGHAEGLLQVLLEREAGTLAERERAATSGRAGRSEWRAAVGARHRARPHHRAPSWRFDSADLQDSATGRC